MSLMCAMRLPRNLCLALAFILPQATTAQSHAEAAAANLALAIELCGNNISSARAIANAYQRAGFAVSFVSGVSTEQYQASAPAQTLSARFGAHFCEIETRFMGVGQSVPFVAAVLRQRLRAAPRSYDLNDNCRGHTVNDTRFFVLSVGSVSGSPRPSCIENGTTRIQFQVPG